VIVAGVMPVPIPAAAIMIASMVAPAIPMTTVMLAAVALVIPAMAVAMILRFGRHRGDGHRAQRQGRQRLSQIVSHRPVPLTL
jgi:heme/copper-type cytochrome/quinol oxidase subunit 2